MQHLSSTFKPPFADAVLGKISIVRANIDINIFSTRLATDTFESALLTGLLLRLRRSRCAMN